MKFLKTICRLCLGLFFAGLSIIGALGFITVLLGWVLVLNSPVLTYSRPFWFTVCELTVLGLVWAIHHVSSVAQSMLRYTLVTCAACVYLLATCLTIANGILWVAYFLKRDAPMPAFPFILAQIVVFAIGWILHQSFSVAKSALRLTIFVLLVLMYALIAAMGAFTATGLIVAFFEMLDRQVLKSVLGLTLQLLVLSAIAALTYRISVTSRTALILVAVGMWMVAAPGVPVVFVLLAVFGFQDHLGASSLQSNVSLLIASSVMLALVIHAMVPKRKRFRAPGTLIATNQHPQLWNAITEISGRLGLPTPDRLYITADCNAWVRQCGGFAGLGGSSVLAIGLPMLQHLTVGELYSVLAHECGHIYSGDVLLGPWIFKTRISIRQVVDQIDASYLRDNGLETVVLGRGSVPWMIWKLFTIYLKLFFALTNDVCRRQELEADHIAARLYGTENFRRALVKIDRAQIAFERYWITCYEPLIRLGVCPPLLDGFRCYVANDTGAALHVNEVPQKPGTSVDDTHPSVESRVGRLNDIDTCNDAGRSDCNASALILLEPDPFVERNAICDGANLNLVAANWADIERRVLPAHWENVVSKTPVFPTYESVGSFYFRCRYLLDKVATGGDSGTSVADRVYELERSLCSELSLALTSAGWSVELTPGCPLRLYSELRSIQPQNLVRGVLSGAITQSEWTTICHEAKITDLHPGVTCRQYGKDEESRGFTLRDNNSEGAIQRTKKAIVWDYLWQFVLFAGGRLTTVKVSAPSRRSLAVRRGPNSSPVRAKE